MSDNSAPIDLKAQFKKAQQRAVQAIGLPIISGIIGSWAVDGSLFNSEPHSLKSIFAGLAICAIGFGIGCYLGKKANAIADETVLAIQSGIPVQPPKP